MMRLDLTTRLTPDHFRSFYWLKEELVTFCRDNGLSTGGRKGDLLLRIEAFLLTGDSVPSAPHSTPTPPRGTMAREFHRDTVIGPGWRCSQGLRAFFEGEIGPSFHFNETMRDFISTKTGHTLQEAIGAWEKGRATPRQPKEIPAQFEYNRHIRDYFQERPGATLDDAIDAWKKKKARKRIVP
jgi:hypothetical protein